MLKLKFGFWDTLFKAFDWLEWALDWLEWHVWNWKNICDERAEALSQEMDGK